MRLHHFISTLLLLFFTTAALAWQVEKKLLFAIPDTVVDEHLSLTFDSNGNYCYYRRYPDPISLFTNTRTYGPFQKSTVNRAYELIIFYNEDQKDQYLKYDNGTGVFGPIQGEIDKLLPIITHNRGELYFAFTVLRGDTVDYYINGILTASTGSEPCTQNWNVFSKNGHVLYTIRKNQWNYLYLDQKPVDSTLDDYNWLQVDDAGRYCYTLGRFVPDRAGTSFKDFAPLPAYMQKKFGTVNTVQREYRSSAHDSVYMYFNENGRCILRALTTRDVAKLYPDLIAQGKEEVSLKIDCTQNSGGYQPCPDDSTTQITVNHKTIKLPYQNIFLPCLDSSGNYALFGQRGYYMYANVNSKERKQPLSKHGVRAKPISIDVKGNTICYHETDDSVYVYENDKLFGSCPRQDFTMLRREQLINNVWSVNDHYTYRRQIMLSGFNITGFHLGAVCHIVYHNTISPSMLKFRNYYGEPESTTGDVIYSVLNEYGYCILQKTGERQYSFMVNNHLVPLPSGVNFDTPIRFWLCRNFSFTGNEFIFYSKEGTGIYQYKMKL